LPRPLLFKTTDRSLKTALRISGVPLRVLLFSKIGLGDFHHLGPLRRASFDMLNPAVFFELIVARTESIRVKTNVPLMTIQFNCLLSDFNELRKVSHQNAPKPFKVTAFLLRGAISFLMRRK